MLDFRYSETTVPSLEDLGQRIRKRHKASGLRIDDAAAPSRESPAGRPTAPGSRGRCSLREMLRMGQAAADAASRQSADEIYRGEERTLVCRIADYVQGQARKLIEMARPMLRVDRA